MQPKPIVCDEPTSALDVNVQVQILNLLETLQRELGLAYLFITHNIGVVEYIADQVAAMQAGHIVEQGEGEAVLQQPRHEYTRTLLAAVPRLAAAVRGSRLVRGHVVDAVVVDNIELECGILEFVRRTGGTMTIPVHDLAAEVLELPAEDRARMLELLIASFEPKSNAQRAWMGLALRRREEVRSGKVAMVPGDEALERVKARVT